MRGFSHESHITESIEWYTPPEVFDALGLTFDLDPCSPGHGLCYVPATNVYTAADDGLTQEWAGTCFVNPPYGRATAGWMRRLADHGDGIALVFARTDVAWFQEIAPLADSVCFVSGRLHFYQGQKGRRGGAPGAGSCLLAFGGASASAVELSQLGLTGRLT